MASEVDRTFPDNEHVEIVGGRPVIGRFRAKATPNGADRLEQLLKERIEPLGILDVLVETENWLGWTRHSDRSPDTRRRSTALASGTVGHVLLRLRTGTCPDRPVAEGLDRRQIAWVDQRHVTEEKLDEAITALVNAYNRFSLPRCWGSGKHASADGMKWDLYERNLLSECHVRYGGYGGIGYYHVSDTYVALFSHFIPCGVWEADYILDGLAEEPSDIQPDTVHADTQGQSTPSSASPTCSASTSCPGFATGRV